VQNNNKLSEVISFIRSIIVIIVLVLIIRGSLIEPFKIPSGSMIPTLKISDQILVSKISFGLRAIGFTNTIFRWASPKRADVVVFMRPDDPATSEDDSEINLIKRVVALAGETVEVKNSQVFINGTALDEPYARWSEGGRPDGNFGPMKVPEGKIFLLGDNRDESKDSRYWSDPFIDIDRVKGRALMIYWTFDGSFWSRVGMLIR
jgi:signal peptidase I